MASINDLATAASALVNPAAPAPHPPLPNPAQTPQIDDEQGTTQGEAQTPSEPPVARGALVVLEGLDRSGKTTQVKLLEQRFVELGRKVKVMRFPGTYREITNTRQDRALKQRKERGGERGRERL